MIHIILFSVIVIALLGRKSKIGHKIAFLLLALFSAIRYEYGNDYLSYLKKFQYIKMGYESPFDNEILYTLLNRMMPSFYLLIAVTSIFYIYQIYKLLENNLKIKQIWLGLFIFLINPYLYLMNLSAIRQCIAMCFFIIAVSFAHRKELKKYVLFIVIAALFHKSAILLLPVYVLMSEKSVKKRHVLLIVAAIMLGLSFSGIHDVVELVLSFFNDVNYMYYMQDAATNSLRATILSGIYLIYILFNLPKLKGKYVIYGKLYLISTILAVLAYRLSMFTRIQMYFDIFSVVILPYLFCENFRNGKIKIYLKNDWKTIWGFTNQYILPALMIAIYFLRYYSFFTNPMWKSFAEYRTILDLL